MRRGLLCLAFCAGAATAAQAASGCGRLAVEIEQDDPTRATLSWSRDARAVSYFVQYRTGKFPTQEQRAPAPGDRDVQVVLRDLRPGQSYVVEICEAYAPGACPSGPPSESCVTEVEVTAATAWRGVVQPDPDRAICTMRSDSETAGRSVGGPDGGTIQANSASACCALCAAREPALPYAAQCVDFVFDVTTRRCLLLRENTGEASAPGKISGSVRAWPQAP